MSFQIFAIECATGRRRMVCGTFSERTTQPLLASAFSEIATIEIVGPDGRLTTAKLDKLLVANDAARDPESACCRKG
jgi:hypothetical protein